MGEEEEAMTAPINHQPTITRLISNARTNARTILNRVHIDLATSATCNSLQLPGDNLAMPVQCCWVLYTNTALPLSCMGHTWPGIPSKATAGQISSDLVMTLWINNARLEAGPGTEGQLGGTTPKRDEETGLLHEHPPVVRTFIRTFRAAFKLRLNLRFRKPDDLHHHVKVFADLRRGFFSTSDSSGIDGGPNNDAGIAF
ncbi:hypothetical protein DFH06DRAFT_1296697 [Mycena polygramma]|nr:hypothetical protein DFH06DRAFT_1296697 [Mycena polygramma]